MEKALKAREKLSDDVQAALEQIAIEYHIKTEKWPGSSTEALNEAYLEASQYGVEGVQVRKAIAEIGNDPLAGNYIAAEVNQYHRDNPKPNGKRIEPKKAKMAARIFIVAALMGAAAAAAKITTALWNLGKSIEDGKEK